MLFVSVDRPKPCETASTTVKIAVSPPPFGSISRWTTHLPASKTLGVTSRSEMFPDNQIDN